MPVTRFALFLRPGERLIEPEASRRRDEVVNQFYQCRGPMRFPIDPTTNVLQVWGDVTTEPISNVRNPFGTFYDIYVPMVVPAVQPADNANVGDNTVKNSNAAEAPSSSQQAPVASQQE